MVDVTAQYVRLKEELDAAVSTVLASGRFILGPNVQAFEEEAAQYLGVAHAVAVASGTDALHLALVAAGIGPGDEVITTPFTFIATAEAIRYVGARPVFVDIDPRTFNLDVQHLESALTPATRAVLPVHLFGQPADMGRITAFCDRHDLILIEDCAQSFGATWGDRQTGSLGDFGCFSFFPSKNLGGCGDGGLITTASAEQAEHLRALRNHGSRRYAHHDEIGFNSRLDELQAAILRVKLRHIEAFNDARRGAARRYGEWLGNLPLILPYEDPAGRHVYHQFTLLLSERDAVREKLTQADIASMIYYPLPLHRQIVFRQDYVGLSLPIVESVAQRCLSLPIYPEIGDARIERVAKTLQSAF
ncbi:MAG: DegT/DnrJ/EryC1/StrS family aminotransferase [Gammaproteobacteria bacterium]|nr:DegT/DnrJ/EryC1/StrS family aminotransferase [Gammaproteobacteria bacterium]MCP5458108.1 DegT/DnrJ/EryC1/StrS family aminotransferase [Gammaproteobacteria bacterium]